MSDQQRDDEVEERISMWSSFFLRMQLILNTISNEHKNALSVLIEMCRSGQGIKHEALARDVRVKLIAEGVLEQTDNIRLGLTQDGLAFIRELTGESESYFKVTLDTLDDELLRALNTLISSRSSAYEVKQAAINILIEKRVLYYDGSGQIKVNILAKRIFSEILAERAEA